MRKPGLLAGTLLLGLGMGVAGTSPATAAGAAGSLDPTFGNGGIVLSNLGIDAGGVPIQGLPSDAAQLGNGDVVVAGIFGLARYLPTGRLDATFGTGGVSEIPPGNGGSFPPGLAVQPDGKYVWAGAGSSANGTVSSFSVVRFNTDGSLDNGFGTGGVATAAIPNSAVQGADTVLVQPNGKILLGGEAFLRGYHAPVVGALARFNADGTPDATFGTGGQVVAGPAVGNVTTLGEDATGNIVVLPAHAEFTPAGQPTALVPAAITTSSHGGAATFRPDGSYVVATAVSVAKHDTDIQVKRFNADGSVAVSGAPFNFSGVAGRDQAQDSVNAVAVQPDGQIVVSGTHFLGTAPIGLARLNPDGTLDATFGNGGTVTTTVQGNETATALLLQPDGRILAVGDSEDNSTGTVDVVLLRYLG